MLATYRAVLRGNRLEWQDTPESLEGLEEIPVYVTILDETEPSSKKNNQGRKMADALEALAALPIRSIADPAKWQRETRQERELMR
jgi:hypothetical protein